MEFKTQYIYIFFMVNKNMCFLNETGVTSIIRKEKKGL